MQVVSNSSQESTLQRVIHKKVACNEVCTLSFYAKLIVPWRKIQAINKSLKLGISHRLKSLLYVGVQWIQKKKSIKQSDSKVPNEFSHWKWECLNYDETYPFKINSK